MDVEARTEALARLAGLERQLDELRRTLGAHRTRFPPPRGSFQAVRVVVGDGDYAVTSAAVREIVRYARLTPVPGAPVAVRGVLNLRGERVAVLDLRRLLGAADTRPDLKTVILVFEAYGKAYGLLVDRVIDVVTLNGDDVDEHKMAVDRSPFVSAAWCRESRVLQLLDVAEIVSPTAVALAEAHALDSRTNAEAAHETKMDEDSV
jgi:purine-binding chemotaxis protein CheW